MENSLKIMLDDGAFMPERAHEDDAGLDLFSTVNCTIPRHGSACIETGVHIAIPKGYFGLLTSKSGLMRKRGLTCRGTIDSGYTGTIQAVMFNHSDEDVYIECGQKLVQLVILPCLTMPVEIVDRLDATERGDGGFGSTGDKKTHDKGERP